MKRLLTAIATSIVLSIAHGQDLKKQKVKNDYPLFKETFYVLKSDPTIKHGKYEKQYGGLVTKGEYEISF